MSIIIYNGYRFKSCYSLNELVNRMKYLREKVKDILLEEYRTYGAYQVYTLIRKTEIFLGRRKR